MKFLVFKIGAIGDVLLTTPAIKKIKEIFPESEIHYFVGEKASHILKNNPFVDRIIIFEEKYPHLSRFFKILAMKNWFLERFKNTKYDFFIDFESSYYSAYISFYIKAKQKIGFKIKDPRRYLLNFVYNKRFDYKEKNYQTKRYLALITDFFNLKSDETTPMPVLKLTEKEIKSGKNILNSMGIAENDKKIMLGISGTWITKQWPVNNWIKLINLLTQKFNKAKIIILWGPRDENFLPHFKNLPCFIIPPLNLRELAGIINYCDILISNDNGIRHIATALNKKTIGIFGPTDENVWALEDANTKIITSDIKCRPCDKTRCKDILCMENVLPEKVCELIIEMI